MTKHLLETELFKSFSDFTTEIPLHQLPVLYDRFETRLSELVDSAQTVIETIRQIDYAIVELTAIKTYHPQKKSTRLCS